MLRPMNLRLLLLPLPMLVAACGQGENTPGPGGVTVGEARALDEAAEMIEQGRLPQSALTPAVPQRPASQAAIPATPSAR